MTPGTGLFKEQTQPSLEIGVGGTVAGIGTVEYLLAEIERTNAV